MIIIFKALYFFLPAYLANMAPVFASALFGSIGGAPIDGGKVWKGKPVFGPHKTWRGVWAGTIVGIITVYIQQAWYVSSDFFHSLSILNYSNYSFIIFGALLGGGALAGDLVKSFFKRRRSIPAGSRWFPYDQLDFVIGGLVFGSLIYRPPVIVILILLVFSPILHIVANRIGYALKIKDTKW